MNLWMRLPRHDRNIVPFDRVIIDELEGRVIGFTNAYIPGGNLEDNKSRVFKLEWLRRLVQLVDELNLRYDIAHQDIAPHSLVANDSTDSVMLFDFNYAARINYPLSENGEGGGYDEARNDTKGLILTTYEIITRDDSIRDKPHEEQTIDVLALEWGKHPEVTLDHPVASYQLILREWEKRRGDFIGVEFDDFPRGID